MAKFEIGQHVVVGGEEKIVLYGPYQDAGEERYLLTTLDGSTSETKTRWITPLPSRPLLPILPKEFEFGIGADGKPDYRAPKKGEWFWSHSDSQPHECVVHNWSELCPVWILSPIPASTTLAVWVENDNGTPGSRNTSNAFPPSHTSFDGYCSKGNYTRYTIDTRHTFTLDELWEGWGIRVAINNESLVRVLRDNQWLHTDGRFREYEEYYAIKERRVCDAHAAACRYAEQHMDERKVKL